MGGQRLNACDERSERTRGFLRRPLQRARAKTPAHLLRSGAREPLRKQGRNGRADMPRAGKKSEAEQGGAVMRKGAPLGTC